MTEYKEKCLALRRRRDEIEHERARRAEDRATWLKYIAALILMVAMTAAAYLIVASYNRRVDEEIARARLIHEVSALRRESADILRERPHDGLAALGYIIGTAMLNRTAKEG